MNTVEGVKDNIVGVGSKNTILTAIFKYCNAI